MHAEELAGLKVRHGLDKVLEGGAVVLTLKDSSILEDGEVNEGTTHWTACHHVCLSRKEAQVRSHRSKGKQTRNPCVEHLL